jgi:multimeric flavodoxin WrbA
MATCWQTGVRVPGLRAWEAVSVVQSPELKRLLVVFQSRSGGTQSLVDEAERGAQLAIVQLAGDQTGGDRAVTSLEVKHAFDTTPDDVIQASAIILATPANFGYMSGAMKDFFERIYHPCLEVTASMPYAMIVKGDTDVDGAAASVERIATGMRWREVLRRLCVVGDVKKEHLDAAFEMGATIVAGLDAGIY